MKKYFSPTTITAIFIGLSMGLSSLANADGLYLGGGAYLTRAETQNLDETDGTLAAQVGYGIVDLGLITLSSELGFYDLGEYTENGVNVDAEAIGVAAVGNLSVLPFLELYAKLGIADVDVQVNNNDFDGTEDFRGIGMALDIFDTIDIYLEYLEFDTEVDSKSLGVGVRLDLPLL